MVRRRRTASAGATHKGWYIPGAGTHFGRAFKGLGEMVPVRAPLSQRGRNIRAKQAPRAPGQVRDRHGPLGSFFGGVSVATARTQPVQSPRVQSPRSHWLCTAALIARSSAAISRRRSIACAVLRPCFKAFLLPFGAPGDGPPCIRQRPFFIAGDWQGLPRRVRARHRGAWCMGKCMGLFLRFRCEPSPPRLSTLPTMA